jgi:hypothetical protein
MNYHTRKFLNPKKGVAAIECYADMSSKWCDISVKIADCNKVVSLEFDFSDMKEYKEKRAKLLLLINELQQLRLVIDNTVANPEFKKGMK